MRESNAFQPGLETLLSSKAGWLRGRRVALLSHAAAVDRQGCNSATRLAAAANLVALFSPEHGYNSDAPAGAPVANRRHPDLGITIRSLYGEQHKPTPAMLRDIDLIVVDLQDLGVRCYTYVSTLRHLLHAAASAGKSVIIADRPIPLPHVVDGPPRDEAFDSFVAAVSCPLVYGMTPGETAQWICAQDQLEINCRVAPMRNYHRDSMRGSGWPPWLPPSPGIATWESAWCYPATVFTEAMPSVSCGRTGRLPFQVLGAPWLKVEPLLEQLAASQLPGVHFHAHPFNAPYGQTHRRLSGIRLTVTDPTRFRPVLTSLAILSALQTSHGPKHLWRGRGCRPEFFDKLYGTDAVRLALLDRVEPAAIAATWKSRTTAFKQQRKAALLYDSPARA